LSIVSEEKFSTTTSTCLDRPRQISQPFSVFRLTVILFLPRFSIMKYIKQTMDDTMIVFDILGNGMQRLDRVDEKIEKNVEAHVKSRRFQAPGKVSFDKVSQNHHMQLMEETLRNIAEIVRLSEEHGFNLYIFINPIHRMYYLQHSPELFLMFKEKLAGITDYWDFSGFNSITTNNYYYYETSHYRPLVGHMVTCRITGCANIKVPADFGVLITSDNVSGFIAKKKEELAAYEAGLEEDEE